MSSGPRIAADLVICRLAQAASPSGGEGVLRGEALGQIDLLEGDVWIACDGGEIVAVGPGHEIRDRLLLAPDHRVIDAHGMVAIPGLVDCHTHACFAGDRAAEFEMRSGGADYEELHAAGGGILSTVRATREASEDDLVARVERHLRWMLAQGTTAVEVKSGYGLSRESELRMLRAIARAGRRAPQRVRATVLALHSVPSEAASADDYVADVVDGLLPEVVAGSLAIAADVFVERDIFDVEQARRYLNAARGHDLALRMHADQFSELGAVPLAIELEARSIDHLEATSPESARALAVSGVAAVLLPTAALVLDRPMPPARELIDGGGIVAIATDFNPGSSFCESLPLAMSLACTKMRMTPAEALAACTVNAAHVLGLERTGRLQAGQAADIVVLDAPDWRYLSYHLGTPAVRHVVAGGSWVLGA